MENIKTALVHDWLPIRRGGEKVFEIIAEIFPDAPIYTLFHTPGSQIPALENREIRTSFISRLPFVKKKFRSYLPLFPLAAELFDLQEFDLIISSSHCVAKGVIPKPEALHLSYVHSPIRYAWNQYHSYFASHKLGVFSRFLIPPVIHYLRMWDISSTVRVDHFAVNSLEVARRIRRYYGRNAEVIHPPVDNDFFHPEGDPEDYYLIVSALVPYKKIDLAVEAFNQSGYPLKIVGQGPDYKKLKKAARSNIEFLGYKRDEELRTLYRKAKAFIMPGEEDFGITVLEAQACGTPVIAFGRGGALETVAEGQTGLFFLNPTPSSLNDVLDNFQGLTFNKQLIQNHVSSFSKPVFKEKLTAFFREKWNEHIRKR